jgi:ABC-type branched-subunit amino acid transport system substrate-binding protein
MQSLIGLLILLMLVGCPHPAPRFDPDHRWNTPSTGNPAARGRFDQARARFERDEIDTAAVEFKSIAHDYPGDPIAPHAELYAGMAAFKQGDLSGAVRQLEPLVRRSADAELSRHARFYLGLAYAGSGRYPEARALLLPFAGIAITGDEGLELWAALAAIHDAAGETALALEAYDHFFAGANRAERAHIVARLRSLVGASAEATLGELYGHLDKGGPAAAIAAERLAELRCQRGDAAGAQRALDETRVGRAAAELPVVSSSCASGAGRLDLIGAVLPLSGRDRLVGEAAARGLAVAAGAFDGPSDRVAFSVSVIDSAAPASGASEASDPERAVEDLAAHGAVALVGPVTRIAAGPAARKAAALGLPMISLDVSNEARPEPGVFRIVVPVESRARALAAVAYRLGARQAAVMAPHSAYGDLAGAAFASEFVRLGGKVVVSVRYDRTATSFGQQVAQLAAAPPVDALFVPDTAAHLELIAPALAAGDLVAAELGAPKPRRGRNLLLLSTAEGLAPGFLPRAGRYVRGAIFAPGFYPDDADPVIGPYARTFRAAYGQEPSYLDAYAYDAVQLVRRAVTGGAQSRPAVSAALGKSQLRGLTGTITFDADRGRSDSGLLFTVQPDGASQVIHVLAAP